MWENILQLDSDLLVFLNGFHTPLWDKIIWQITQIWIWLPLFALFLWLLWRHYHKKSFLIFAFIGLSLVFSDRSSDIIKKTVKRPRPSHNELIMNGLHFHQYEDGTFYKGGKYGFVSGHATNGFSLALVLIYFLRPILKRHRWWFLLCPFIFVYTRIYLGVHYPSDIICGAVLGVACATCTIGLYKLANKQIKND
ncbi:MAG: phosphatase PAP2 family protein [Bacteroidales bacterium]|jgi:undecaprenyl-diphosphatase|nr:phosphatase PAP2 family protein [Bacteroidales bacterium]